MKYQEILELFSGEIEMKECFFAFGDRQFHDKIKEFGIEGKKIFSADYGLYGTREGLDDYSTKMKERRVGRNNLIIQECTPQEVYEDEYANYECIVSGNDEEAFNTVVSIFGEAVAAESVERK